MDVSVTALRAELSSWLERVRRGDELVITDRGVPVARIAPVGSATLLENLVRQGTVGPAPAPGRPSARALSRARPAAPVSPLVGEQRR